MRLALRLLLSLFPFAGAGAAEDLVLRFAVPKGDALMLALPATWSAKRTETKGMPPSVKLTSANRKTQAVGLG
jgi:hypothetical protein